MALFDRLLFAIVNWVFWRRNGRLRRWTAKRAKEFPVRPNVGLPRSANDKMTWRKAFDRDLRFVALSDKIALRDWLSEQDLDLKCPELVWQGSQVSEIPEWVWDGDHVIKTNHASGTNVYTKDPGLDRAASEEMLGAALVTTYGAHKMEWGYQDIVPKVFAEVCLPRDRLEEIKIYTFGATCWRIYRTRLVDGALAAQIWELQQNGQVEFEPDTEASATSKGFDDAPLPSWERIQRIASRIGSEFDHVRVDFLAHDENIWLSELTFYNQGGYIARSGHKTSGMPTSLWDLKRSHVLRHRPASGWRRFYFQRLIKHI